MPEVYMMVAGCDSFGGVGSVGFASPSFRKSSHECTFTPCARQCLGHMQALERICNSSCLLASIKGWKLTSFLILSTSDAEALPQ